MVAHIPTGYAVHVLKTVEHHQTLHAKDAGRFWYILGRDGMMTKIDLLAMLDKMIIDSKTQKLEAMIGVDKKPHPGPGANWNDPACGPVSGTSHLLVKSICQETCLQASCAIQKNSR